MRAVIATMNVFSSGILKMREWIESNDLRSISTSCMNILHMMTLLKTIYRQRNFCNQLFCDVT